MFFENYFKNYIIHEQETRSNNIVSSINKLYNNGNFDVNSIENLGMIALEEGMIIKVKDNQNNIIWDATLHNNGLCKQMLEHMAQNMSNKYLNENAGYVENKYNILSDSNVVGTLELGYYGPFYFNDHDLSFINGINKIIFVVGIITLLLSLIIGSIISNRITKPILKVINKTKHISDGYFDEVITDKSNTKEIAELISSVNDLAKKLENQENLRKKLTSNVAHELRTPLTSIKVNLEAMIDGVLEIDERRLKSCNEEISRLTRLVSDLEKLTNCENENLVLNKEKFDLFEIINSIIKIFEKDFIDKNISVKINGNIYNEKIIIYADKDKIIQIIINILSNSIKYSKKSINIDINITKVKKNNNEYINIAFKDNGIGISKENLPYIFERFYMVDKSRNSSLGGSGIGLTICKAIIEAHNGNIKINSELDIGTEIIIELPNISV